MLKPHAMLSLGLSVGVLHLIGCGTENSDMVTASDGQTQSAYYNLSWIYSESSGQCQWSRPRATNLDDRPFPTKRLSVSAGGRVRSAGARAGSAGPAVRAAPDSNAPAGALGVRSRLPDAFERLVASMIARPRPLVGSDSVAHPHSLEKPRIWRGAIETSRFLALPCNPRRAYPDWPPATHRLRSPKDSV